jgi:hypothetical protein
VKPHLSYGNGSKYLDSSLDILNQLIEAVEPDHVQQQVSRRLDEITAAGAAKAAFAATAFTWALSQFKLPKPSQFSKRGAAQEWARKLIAAKDDREAAAACVGLMNVCSRTLLGIPQLKDIGFRLTKLVQSSAFEDL